jgi:hypothetical protein
MPTDLWKRLKEHLTELKARGEYVTASAVVARLVREYLDKAEQEQAETGGKKRRQTWSKSLSE